MDLLGLNVFTARGRLRFIRFDRLNFILQRILFITKQSLENKIISEIIERLTGNSGKEN